VLQAQLLLHSPRAAACGGGDETPLSPDMAARAGQAELSSPGRASRRLL